jgi:anti-sigma factor RsiW
MSLGGGVTDQDLHDYVDGRLDTAHRQRVEEFLAVNPEEAMKVASYRRQIEALHALYDDALQEPVPARLRALLDKERAAK